MRQPEYTRIDRNRPYGFATREMSPSLAFQKWHGWDRFEQEVVEKNNRSLTLDPFKKEDNHVKYLIEVADEIEKINIQKGHLKRWLTRHEKIMRANGCFSTTTNYRTIWRMIVGWNCNPAMETGLSLHPHYGFPVIPGSAVKGLLHHVAEMRLENKYGNDVRNAHWKLFNKDTIPTALAQYLQELKKVKLFFGSIHLEQPLDNDSTSSKISQPAAETHRVPGSLDQLLLLNKSLPPASIEAVKEELDLLLGPPTGSILCCYDAVPTEEATDLLQVDILNSHYQAWYEQKGVPPSDDMQPNPTHFLAVSPGTPFHFFFRYRNPARFTEFCTDDESIDDFLNALLHIALTEYGIGAKTAAGYGYFEPFTKA